LSTLVGASFTAKARNWSQNTYFINKYFIEWKAPAFFTGNNIIGLGICNVRSNRNKTLESAAVFNSYLEEKYWILFAKTVII
jgi:hypothetical protein